MASLLRPALLLLGAGLCPGCYLAGDATVLITSTPPGASIAIDGQDTGETTPAKFDFARFGNFGGAFASDRQVTLTKAGFDPERRTLHHRGSLYSSKWIDGATMGLFWTSPFWWTFGDFFVPFAWDWRYVPHELHVKLYPVGEAPGRRDEGDGGGR